MEPSCPKHDKRIVKAKNELLALPLDHSNYTPDVVEAAACFLAVLECIDFGNINEPWDKSGSASGCEIVHGAAVTDPASKSMLTPPRQIPLKTQVACYVNVNNRCRWVLGHIASYFPDLKNSCYEVVDLDDEKVVYEVAKEDVRIVPKMPLAIPVNTRVLAVYPETTVFYSGILVREGEQNWRVLFDADEFGAVNDTQDVNPKLVMLP